MLTLTPDDFVAIRLSLQVAVTATVVTLPIGFGVAYLLAMTDIRGKAVLEGIVNLPLVLPPVVTGFLVLILSAPQGPLRAIWSFLGVTPAFTPYGAVIASGLVAFPLLARSAAAGFASVDDKLVAAAAGFGAGPGLIFRSVIWPQAKPALWS